MVERGRDDARCMRLYGQAVTLTHRRSLGGAAYNTAIGCTERLRRVSRSFGDTYSVVVDAMLGNKFKYIIILCIRLLLYIEVYHIIIYLRECIL